jgi:hypothetical protein
MQPSCDGRSVRSRRRGAIVLLLALNLRVDCSREQRTWRFHPGEGGIGARAVKVRPARFLVSGNCSIHGQGCVWRSDVSSRAAEVVRHSDARAAHRRRRAKPDKTGHPSRADDAEPRKSVPEFAKSVPTRPTPNVSPGQTRFPTGPTEAGPHLTCVRHSTR